MKLCSSLFRRLTAKDLIYDHVEEEEALRAMLSCPERLASTSLLSGNTMMHDLAVAGSLPLLRAAIEATRSSWQQLEDRSDQIKILGLTFHHHDSADPRSSGPEETLQRLLNQKNKDHQTPLILAAKGKHADVLEYLLSQGADPWVADRLGGLTALHYATLAADETCIKAILDSVLPESSTSNGIRIVDCRSLHGFTPLHYAALLDVDKPLQMLLRYKPDIRAASVSRSYSGALQIFNRRVTPLHVAAGKGNVEAVSLLLKDYAWRCVSGDISSGYRSDPRRDRDGAGITPLMLMLHSCVPQPDRDILMYMLSSSTNVYTLFPPDEVTGEGGGPVKLARLAAKTLQEKLLRELTSVGGSQGHAPPNSTEQESPAPSAPISPEAQEHQLQSALSMNFCGICLDNQVDTLICDNTKNGCCHQFCHQCMLDLCTRIVDAPALCPFCRAPIPAISYGVTPLR